MSTGEEHPSDAALVGALGPILLELLRSIVTSGRTPERGAELIHETVDRIVDELDT